MKYSGVFNAIGEVYCGKSTISGRGIWLRAKDPADLPAEATKFRRSAKWFAQAQRSVMLDCPPVARLIEWKEF